MLKPGMFISGRYEIIDKVGSGGMADVYKARDQRLNRFVAIKVLKPEYSSDKSFVNKFRGEAQSAAGLSHPNIVNVYDVGDDGGLYYIVMELVEGITLKRFIERKGKLEVKEAVGIAIQIAQGMEAAHDNHIIHRDIKPQNIIISRDGKVKVTDFGIAKATNSNTITSNAMGSVHYLSPEQARGGYSDEKSDIYSLGVTMYEMLSGKVPFAGDNTVSVALLHIQGEAMPLRELDPEIPVSVDKIVQKCMQKRPERRYHTASELISDLKRSITNPDGDFVQIPAFVASDSPTINIGDDISRIKNGTYMDDDMRPTKNIAGVKLDEEDDEDLDTVDSKVEKVFLVGTIVAAVVLGVVVIGLVAWLLTSNLNKDKGDDSNVSPTTGAEENSPTPSTTEAPTGAGAETYTVPEVLGYTEEDARALWAVWDSTANITIKQDYSEDIEEGLVMKQYPEAGNSNIKGAGVILTLSVGKEPKELPPVDNLTEAQAEKKLVEEYGLVIKREYEESDIIAPGRVIRTVPEKGTMVTSGMEVTMVISKEPVVTKVAVPSLLGKTEDEASAALNAVGLVLNNTTYDNSDIYPVGQISYQSYSMNTMVDQGTLIDITVSIGPKEDSGDNGGTDVLYVGMVTITGNPLSGYNDGQTAEIILEMQQPGFEPQVIWQEPLSSGDFPFTVPDIVGDSADPGIVSMYIDGVLYSQTWTVEFEAIPVED